MVYYLVLMIAMQLNRRLVHLFTSSLSLKHAGQILEGINGMAYEYMSMSDTSTQVCCSAMFLLQCVVWPSCGTSLQVARGSVSRPSLTRPGMQNLWMTSSPCVLCTRKTNISVHITRKSKAATLDRLCARHGGGVLFDGFLIQLLVLSLVS